MKCNFCGKDVQEGSKFCDGCGASLTQPEAVPQPETTIQPDAFSYQGNYEPQAPKKKTGLIVAIIIISILLVTGIVTGIILIASSGSSSGNSENDIEDRDDDDDYDDDDYDDDDDDDYYDDDDDDYDDDDDDDYYSSNSSDLKKISYTKYEANDDILIVAKNNNNKSMSFEIEIKYYDEDGILIDDDYETIYDLPKNKEAGVVFSTYDNGYSTYKVNIKSASYASYYKSHFNDIDLTTKQDDYNYYLYVVAKNKSNDDIEALTVAVAFYKNGKIVGFSSGYKYDIPAKESVMMTVYLPYDSNYDYVDYDDYKIFITNAYSMDF